MISAELTFAYSAQWVQGRVSYPNEPNLWGCGPGYGALTALIFE